MASTADWSRKTIEAVQQNYAQDAHMLLQQHRRPMQCSLPTYVSPRLRDETGLPIEYIYTFVASIARSATNLIVAQTSEKATTNGQHQNQNASSAKGLHKT
jgi:hypothetical protein